MKITTQKGEQYCTCTELSLKRKEGIRENKHNEPIQKHTQEKRTKLLKTNKHIQVPFITDHTALVLR